ncbi:hypothetical protein F2Q69_00004078 [Brassica cretica]|uniref:SMP domain-containing protein n=1 Tax=Brassica cretica TaxID=69181 RepID=A0A8S9PET9_BRACR|nr:hypothetical protein F2Q69_00004078 [Brassica cretica]
MATSFKKTQTTEDPTVEIQIPSFTPIGPLHLGGTQQITIGQALEATVHTAGKKPVDHSDAAAIQAAEVRASSNNVIAPGGVAASAQSAADYNAPIEFDENKIKLADVLAGAAGKLQEDKAVTKQDAEGVVSAELRNNPNLSTYPGGVVDSVTAAARLNAKGDI